MEYGAVQQYGCGYDPNSYCNPVSFVAIRSSHAGLHHETDPSVALKSSHHDFLDDPADTLSLFLALTRCYSKIFLVEPLLPM
jgi:hypothetical protein